MAARAQRAKKREPESLEREPESPVDPLAVPTAFVEHRARRVALEEHLVQQKQASLRFWALLGSLVFVGFMFAIGVWEHVRALFGI